MKKRYFLSILFLSLLSVSCFEDLDDNVQIASDLEIQQFIYRGLNYFYVYKSDTPELANNFFESDTDKNEFLKSYNSPEDLFAYLKSPQDRFSNLYSDYTVIENALNGVNTDNGMKFGLVYYPEDNGNIFGYVRYILPNTDAESKGLKRGDIFTEIDGKQLNDSNFIELLGQDNYTITLATYDGSNFNKTGATIPLSKSQYNENPVFITKTIDLNGQKVGYIAYNSFTRLYDSQLNDAFAQLKSAGVTNLVLDLRYNGGGSVETATDLASMITGQFTGQVFYKEFWNEDRQAEFSEDGLFDTKISDGAAINSLNLSTVYILTTQRTASASELIINGLSPYINTVQIGENTTGKFQASFLLYDAPAPNFSRNQANPRHTYAMLPLVYKSANAVGNTDYVDGLFPDISLKEDFFNLGELGEMNEPFLAAALNEISPVPQPVRKNKENFEEISGSEKFSPLNGIMIGEMPK